MGALLLVTEFNDDILDVDGPNRSVNVNLAKLYCEVISAPPTTIAWEYVTDLDWRRAEMELLPPILMPILDKYLYEKIDQNTLATIASHARTEAQKLLDLQEFTPWHGELETARAVQTWRQSSF